MARQVDSGARRAVLVVALVLLIVGVAASVFLINREHRHPPAFWNRDAAAAAVIVYQPGMSSLPERVLEAFAEGLAGAGWRVEAHSVGPTAPGDLSGFQLAVFLSPVYWWSPSPPMARYLDRVQGLTDKRTVIVLTASGASGRAMEIMKAAVSGKGARIETALSFYRWRPNDESDTSTPNEEVAVRIARRAGGGIQPER